MKIKKRFFSLIEVIIALFLSAIIITSLFSFFKNVMKIESDVENAKKTAFQNENLHIRLNQIFFDIKNSDFYLDENNELYFIFDNGIDKIAKYSNEVFAKLALKDNNLTLFISDKYLDENNKDFREEVLFKNVKKLEYKFLAKKDEKLKVKKDFVSNDLYWHYQWLKDFKKLPIYINLNVNDLEYNFFIMAKSFNILELN
jgi:type II secretory pathway component PulJ